ncbi:DoxX family protein [Oceanibacterium hippocampi]|uniref:DoxX family protein n=1 Tax=Oceanibacterium hippocampi TaxID=745714 RepID=UPI001C39567C|nr:DoxX family protein [Oceanibacterium hippocampi]
MTLTDLHGRFFDRLDAMLGPWLPGLLARLVFAGVLLVYYLKSAGTKVGDGIAGFFSIADNAYFQILPKVVEAHGYDASQVPFFPYDIIVAAGTYAEFALPLLIVAGLFTRLAALGMIGFVIIQSYVDITAHGVDAATIGHWFDAAPDSAILDQRALWVFLLLILVLRGAGAISLDRLFARGRG